MSAPSPEHPEPITARRKAAFLDRDGVINLDTGYIHRIEDFVFVPGSVAALQALQSAGYLLVVVTNQSGIARGLHTEEDYWRVSEHMQQQLLAADVRLSAVEHCPHLPDALIERYRLDCACRKPATGMLERAAIALQCDLSASMLVGDRVTDIQAGRAAGIGSCWLVRSGAELSAADIALADGVFDDLAACVHYTLRPTVEGIRHA